MQLASKVTVLLIFSLVSYKITTNRLCVYICKQDASSATFSKQLLDNGNEKLAIDSVTKYISFPSIFIPIFILKKLIQNGFPQFATNYENYERLCERAILATKNDVNAINNIIQGQILGKYTTYKSIDTIMNMDEIVNYTIEFFNSLDIPGIPQHILSLKIGAPIIRLHNINPPRMSNGTRISVKKNA